MGWHCASCHQLITSVNKGRVEWLASEDDHGATILSGLRLVHRESCRYDPQSVFRSGQSVVEGLSLERFVGPDGLILLLSLLAAGELPAAEVIEMAKRVQISRYELARNLIGQQNFPQVLPSSLGHGCYLQSEIAELSSTCNDASKLAGTTGLEPAASAVTGQRSNQLNYVPSFFVKRAG